MGLAELNEFTGNQKQFIFLQDFFRYIGNTLQINNVCGSKPIYYSFWIWLLETNFLPISTDSYRQRSVGVDVIMEPELNNFHIWGQNDFKKTIKLGKLFKQCS